MLIFLLKDGKLSFTETLISDKKTLPIRAGSKVRQKCELFTRTDYTYSNELEYKNYKNLFEKIKNQSKTKHYSTLLKKYQGNSKQTWKVMKEVIGKTKLSVDEFPKKLSINNEEIFNKQLIANHFNNYFINVGSNLAAKIPHSEKHFTSVESKEKLENNELNEKEFKKAFESLKPNKSSGFDEINPNVVRCSYGELFYPLFQICKQSIKFGIFPDKMKIAKIKPVFKSGETEIVSIYIIIAQYQSYQYFQSC